MPEPEAPMDKVTVWAEEKIGLPNYSNVVIGNSYSRVIPAGSSADEVKKNQEELAELVEGFIAVERAKVLESVQT